MVDISQGAMIVQEKSSNSIHFYPTTAYLIYHSAALDSQTDKKLTAILTVFEGYAFENNLFVSSKEFCCESFAHSSLC